MKTLFRLLSILGIACFVLIESTCGPDCEETAKEQRIQYLMSQMYHNIPDAPIPGTPAAAVNMNQTLRQALINRQAYVEEFMPQMSNPNIESKFLIAEDPSGGEDQSTLTAYFPMTEDLDKYEIIGGALIIATNMGHGHKRIELNVQVFEKNEDQTLGEMVATKTVRLDKAGRINFDVPASVLERWHTSRPIGGVFVSAIHNGRNVAIHPQQEIEGSGDTMILHVFLRNKNFDGNIRVQPNNTLSRSKRAAKHICTKQTDKTGCCLFELVVDFRKIGWGWVITPTLYNAYMCRGDCSLNGIHMYHDQTHSKVMRSVNGVVDVPNVNMASLGYCCHPTEYDYLNMMYVNQYGTVMNINIPGMIASRCGCA